MEEEIITSTAAGTSKRVSRCLGLETLRELVLLMIFQMLPLSDRAYLGSVCKRFNALMYYPSVWRNISLRTTLQDGFSVLHGLVEAAGLCQSDEFMIKKFDTYLQNVSVYINGGFLQVSLFHTLSELARKRTLKRLVFLEAETVQERTPLITTSLFSVNDLLATVTDFLSMLDPATTAIKMHLVFLLDDDDGGGGGGGGGGEKYELPSENPSATKFGPVALLFQDDFFLDNCMLLP